MTMCASALCAALGSGRLPAILNQNGFTEINIPVLEHTTGGADANPFVTHMDALDQDFYLRISHELPLKRLLAPV